MKSILAKLVELESAIRRIRDELALKEMAVDRKDLRNVDFGELEEVTPPEWKSWFHELSFALPTEAYRYQDILPNLQVGYPDGSAAVVNIEQKPYISNGSQIGYCVEIWLTGTLDWLTLEFRAPKALVERHSTFHFAWTAEVHASQNLELFLLQTDSHGRPRKESLGKQFAPASPWSEVKLITMNSSANAEETKIIFAFDTKLFHYIALFDARLFVARDPKSPPE